MKEVVAKKYVKALILSLSSDEFDKFGSELKDISNAFLLPKLKVIIDSPDISSKQKADFLFSLLDSASNKIHNFLLLLAERKRLGLIPEISKEFEYQQAVRDGKFSGLISGNFELSAAQKTELEERFSKKFGAKIEFENIKNSYNGIKIELDDLGVEVSFSIDRLKAQMSEYILKAI
ncbi:F0F1 ATP synthase subunit delta [Campylobacter fetus]|uniref:F0F1 ATP synthase subunit delta n=1 Tax=Campylobacter fetus TaxID=196 RepID=UPI0003C2681E|nr:F0F1 ATP synthase subunit delta [Campylobacter fetus]AGZ82331.1 ATP synthase, F1 complex, delta subunit [Campylobacter fetus subsp. testudinum 03-427]AJB46054.1 ATP synthase F0F1 subunit delta [Campylobacter fetus subsp. testudinum]EAI4322030.1 F0F1 ATP synthase subunit delta [Campylobacter fetus]EAI4391664.1 F0F1 ATP synthase subunit delta [Campylobacter fetus]EAK0827182.1 F0F1 ATP synthase subunit delta [Campylobacter fetus]